MNYAMGTTKPQPMEFPTRVMSDFNGHVEYAASIAGCVVETIAVILYTLTVGAFMSHTAVDRNDCYICFSLVVAWTGQRIIPKFYSKHSDLLVSECSLSVSSWK